MIRKEVKCPSCGAVHTTVTLGGNVRSSQIANCRKCGTRFRYTKDGSSLSVSRM